MFSFAGPGCFEFMLKIIEDRGNPIKEILS